MNLLTPRQQLAISVALLLMTGFLLVTSASIHYADTKLHAPFFFARHQAFYIFVALVGAVFVSRISPDQLRDKRLLLVGAALVMLVAVLVIGREVNGSKRWLPLPGFAVQPSEFAKFALLVFAADFLARNRDEIRRVMTLAKLAAVFLIVLPLILVEPDMGTTVVITVTTFAMVFLAGLPMAWIGGLFALGVVGFAVLVFTQPYRLARFTSFMEPWQHQFDSGYQLVQSLIAFGRGEIFGVGLGNSVQKLFYLPEAHTDFVFAVAAEEFGLVGVVLIILMFVGLVGAILRIASERARIGDAYGAYFCWGAAVLFSSQAAVNMGVDMGALPTKGLTLPLVSYGGSSLVASCALIGAIWHLGAPASGVTQKRVTLKSGTRINRMPRPLSRQQVRA